MQEGPAGRETTLPQPGRDSHLATARHPAVTDVGRLL